MKTLLTYVTFLLFGWFATHLLAQVQDRSVHALNCFMISAHDSRCVDEVSR